MDYCLSMGLWAFVGAEGPVKKMQIMDEVF